MQIKVIYDGIGCPKIIDTETGKEIGGICELEISIKHENNWEPKAKIVFENIEMDTVMDVDVENSVVDDWSDDSEGTKKTRMSLKEFFSKNIENSVLGSFKPEEDSKEAMQMKNLDKFDMNKTYSIQIRDKYGKIKSHYSGIPGDSAEQFIKEQLSELDKYGYITTEQKEIPSDMQLSDIVRRPKRVGGAMSTAMEGLQRTNGGGIVSKPVVARVGNDDPEMIVPLERLQKVHDGPQIKEGSHLKKSGTIELHFNEKDFKGGLGFFEDRKFGQVPNGEQIQVGNIIFKTERMENGKSEISEMTNANYENETDDEWMERHGIIYDIDPKTGQPR